MTIADFLTELGQANLAAGAAILVVLALRGPARRSFGARLAYGLWLLAPLAAAATLLPARTETIELPSAPAGAGFGEITATIPAGLDPWAGGLAVWLAGVVVVAGLFAWRQRLFLAEAAIGGVGPAVIGVISPRIILPRDFEARFAPAERQIVLAHETAHLKAHDARVNALVALAQCVSWFNPLVHIAAAALRTDQELACDAMVLARHPSARRTYAEALVKTQLAATPLPIGCYWPARSEHPLTERIAMMKLPTPTKAQRYAGAGAVALLGLSAGLSAWAAQPARTIVTQAPAAASPTAEAAAQLVAPTVDQQTRDRIRAAARAAALAEAQAGQAATRARAAGAGATDQAFRQARAARADALARVVEQNRAEWEAGRMTEDQKKQVEAALARAQAGIAAGERVLADRPQIEAALAQARGAIEAARAAPLSPADETALAQGRADVETARQALQKAEREMAEARAAMARARAALMTQEMQRLCGGDPNAGRGRCLLKGAPGALLEFPGFKDGEAFGFRGGDFDLFAKNKDLPLVFGLEEWSKLMPPARWPKVECDPQQSGRVIRCKAQPEAKDAPSTH